MGREICIYCIPHAGTGGSFFAKWKSYFSENEHIIPLELPGRETRRNEPLCDDMRMIVKSFADFIDTDLTQRNIEEFYLFGYSMGGVIAYELTKILSREYGREPGVLFMGASTVFANRSEKVSEMNEEALQHHLSLIGGVGAEGYPKEYDAVIRNDYRLLEKYHFDFETVKTNIVAFASKQDQAMLYSNVRLLRFLTDDFRLYEYVGNHFFIRKQLGSIVESMKYEIMKVRSNRENGK